MKTKPIGRRFTPEAGFTLIELMIVVAIIAILASVAMYNYADYLRRSKLTEGQNALATYRVSMEQYFQDNRQYVTTAGGAVCGAAIPVLKYFTLTCTGTATTYTATATGIAGTQVAGFAYTVDQLNTRATSAAPAGWSTGAQVCWVLRKGGTCT